MSCIQQKLSFLHEQWLLIRYLSKQSMYLHHEDIGTCIASNTYLTIFFLFQAVLPEECNIKNFTNDWNNGVNLSALIDYCRPGLMPNWRNLNPRDGPENCQRAMEVAQKHFKIPMVLGTVSYSTMWKFVNFPASLIFREINFCWFQQWGKM